MPRTPPHFKVRTSVANHPKTAEVYADNDLLALWTRLGVAAIERYADRTGDSFVVGDRELMALTGKGRLDVARKLLERLALVSPTSASREGNVWRITIANFSEKQGFKPKNGSGMGLSSSATSTSTTVREESRPAEPAPDAVRKPRKVSAPETHPEALEFSAKFLRALGAAHQDPPIKLPTDSAFAGWQREARLMLTTDGRSFDDAKRVASWLFNDQGQAAHFWRKNVLSVGTFRKQFDRLAAAMNAPHHNGGRDEFHGSKILRYLATAEAGDPRPRAGGAVQDPEPTVLRLAELPPGER